MSRNKEREEQEAREWGNGLLLIYKLLTDPTWVKGLQNDLEDIGEMYADCIRVLEGKQPRYHAKRESIMALMERVNDE